MFGGLCWLLHGNMCVGVLNDELIVRVGEKTALELLDSYDFVRPFDITGRFMKGGPDGTSLPEDRIGLIEDAVDFVRPLPPKQLQSESRAKDA